MNFKEALKKFWFIVWEDDSPKGWIISIIFLFVLIKFIFFPGLSLVTGTSLPLAIVESCSMYHDGNLLSNTDNWFLDNKEKYSEFNVINWNFPLRRGFNKGDILLIFGKDPEEIKLGDVIIFQTNRQTPIIHRVMDIEEKGGKYYFSTIGDNNEGQLSIEKSISEDQIIGAAKARIVPYAGWLKLVFFELLRPEQERGFCS